MWSEIPVDHVAVTVMVSDQGPDVASGGRALALEILGMPNQLWLHLYCVFHQLHLIRKRTSILIDSMLQNSSSTPYLTQLLRVCNVWRSPGNHQKLKLCCETLFNHQTAEYNFRTIMGKPSRSRWGSCEGPERKLLMGWWPRFLI